MINLNSIYYEYFQAGNYAFYRKEYNANKKRGKDRYFVIESNKYEYSDETYRSSPGLYRSTKKIPIKKEKREYILRYCLTKDIFNQVTKEIIKAAMKLGFLDD